MMATPNVPGRQMLAYASPALMLAYGLALLWKRTEAGASRVLLYYWVALVLLIEVPILVRHPLVEVAWQGVEHIAMLVAAAWMLTTADARCARRDFTSGLRSFPSSSKAGLWSEFTIS